MDGWNRVKIVFPSGYECWLSDQDERGYRHTTHKCIHCTEFRFPQAWELAELYHGRIV